MAYQPFLSYKREDRRAIDQLRKELTLRGAGGWQDLRDAPLGQRWKAVFKRAIGRDTGGFIWWGTRRSLSSWTIRKLEIPRALRRNRRRWGPPYPVIPLFLDLSPGEDEPEIRAVLGRRRSSQLLDLQGEVRGSGETIAAFARRAARRYVRDLIRSHGDRPLTVAITGDRELTGEHDLCLDWRPLLDGNGRLIDEAVIPDLVQTLADIREAAQSVTRMPEIVVEPHLRLPLAALVGWEWNAARPVSLVVSQRTDDRFIEVPATPTVEPDLSDLRTERLNGDGPAILAVSVGKDLGATVSRYATDKNARSTMHLHVSTAGDATHALSAAEIAGLATWSINRLAEMNAAGYAKHLLILGPGSLAVRIGTGANGTGRTYVPFWDGAAGYRSGVLIG